MSQTSVSSEQALQREIAYLKRENAQLRKERDEAKETSAELASELYWIQEWVANPTVRDKEKVGGISYYQYYKATKPREDGSRYYSRVQVAERLGNVRVAPDKPGNKEQAFGPVHTRLKKSGLIISTVEPQKKNKSLPNYFDQISPQWEDNPRGVVLEYGTKSENYGGKRVALHRGCGGKCLEHTLYICTKCGEAGITEKDVLMIAGEKWERWKKEDASEDVPSVELEETPLDENCEIAELHDEEAYNSAILPPDETPEPPEDDGFWGYSLNEWGEVELSEASINAFGPKR